MTYFLGYMNGKESGFFAKASIEFDKKTGEWIDFRISDDVTHYVYDTELGVVEIDSEELENILINIIETSEGECDHYSDRVVIYDDFACIKFSQLENKVSVACPKIVVKSWFLLKFFGNYLAVNEGLLLDFEFIDFGSHVLMAGFSCNMGRQIICFDLKEGHIKYKSSIKFIKSLKDVSPVDKGYYLPSDVLTDTDFEDIKKYVGEMKYIKLLVLMSEG